MTHLRSEIDIAASARTIFDLARATERWPVILPHYRYVRTLARDGMTKVVAMGATRDGIPISWTAEQIDDPEQMMIGFRHIRGWTRGMRVRWLLEERAGVTRVAIEHDLDFAFPVAREWLGKHLVGGFFIDNIAGKTLARMKVLAEAVS